MKRLGLLALATQVAVAAAGGHVVRVEQAPRREVFVPSGTFVMGVAKDDVGALVTACEQSFLDADTLLSVGQETICTLYENQLKAMSSDVGGEPREIFVSAYAIDRLEVTAGDYRECVNASGCPIDPLVAGDERYIRDEWPLVNVTWDEAQSYCRWRGGRLPTEAEWERAARGDGNDNAVWPWCERDRRDSRHADASCVPRPHDFNHGQARAMMLRDLDRGATSPLLALGEPDDGDGFALLAPPGSYPWSEGPYGTRDQSGNVAEWTADVCSGCTFNRGSRDRLGYEGLPVVNPRRDGGATEPRVVRGGSWRQPEFLGRIDVRDPWGMMYLPNRRFTHIGFRCARSL